MAAKRLEPIHPGEILEEEFMRPLGLSANALARRVDVPVTRISEIVRGKRGITADTALRLGRLFGTSSELWLGLQSEYDLRVARRESAATIQTRIIPLKRPTVRYPGSFEGTRSNVSEQSEPYGAGRAGPFPRDRRRIRRSSLPHGSKRDQKLFLALIDRLARSSDAAEQKRLKEELARFLYAG
jgi:antitoxin HigA-1